jgi:hypothetical protein
MKGNEKLTEYQRRRHRAVPQQLRAQERVRKAWCSFCHSRDVAIALIGPLAAVRSRGRAQRVLGWSQSGDSFRTCLCGQGRRSVEGRAVLLLCPVGVLSMWGFSSASCYRRDLPFLFFL